MKTNTNIPKIISTSIAMILCSSLLAFALTMLGWGGGLPAYAADAACTPPSFTLPSSGAAGSQITVSSSNIPDASQTTCPPLNTGGMISILYDASACVAASPSIGTATMSSAGFFSQTYTLPAGMTSGNKYNLCAAEGTTVWPVGSFTVNASPGTLSLTPNTGGTGTSITVTGSGIKINGSAAVQLEYSANSSCSPSLGNLTATTGLVNVSNGGFTATVIWPSGTTTGTTYYVCAVTSGGTLSAAFAVGSSSSSSGGSVTVDSSSYTVGDSITVSGTGLPVSTSATVELQSADGKTTTTLGNVTTDGNGAFTQDYTVPAHPLHSVVAIVTAGSVTAKSGDFTVNAKSTKKSTTTPAAAAPPPVVPAPAPPITIVETPTPAATDTPTPEPTDTPTAIPSPTAIPTPVPTPVASHNTSIFSGKLPAIVGIGLGTLLGLGILIAVGWLLLRKYLSPGQQTTSMPAPDPVPPWMRAQDMSQQSTMMNGAQFGQTAGFNNPFQPGDGGFAPVGNGFGPPQQSPFNGPPGPNGTQQIPFDDPFQPANNGGFAPVGSAPGPYPPEDWPTRSA